MFRELSKEELEMFANKYLKNWNKDIWKITSISYGNITEYLINEHFLIKTRTNSLT